MCVYVKYVCREVRRMNEIETSLFRIQCRVYIACVCGSCLYAFNIRIICIMTLHSPFFLYFMFEISRYNNQLQSYCYDYCYFRQ